MSILNIMVCMFLEIYKKSVQFHYLCAFNIVILGSEILKWFTHQSVGDTVSAQFTHQNKNKWIGIVVCVVPMPCPNFGNILDCEILSNEHRVLLIYVGYSLRSVKIKSDHLWMYYIPVKHFVRMREQYWLKLMRMDSYRWSLNFNGISRMTWRLKNVGFV